MTPSEKSDQLLRDLGKEKKISFTLFTIPLERIKQIFNGGRKDEKDINDVDSGIDMPRND